MNHNRSQLIVLCFCHATSQQEWPLKIYYPFTDEEKTRLRTNWTWPLSYWSLVTIGDTVQFSSGRWAWGLLFKWLMCAEVYSTDGELRLACQGVRVDPSWCCWSITGRLEGCQSPFHGDLYWGMRKSFARKLSLLSQRLGIGCWELDLACFTMQDQHGTVVATVFRSRYTVSRCEPYLLVTTHLLKSILLVCIVL